MVFLEFKNNFKDFFSGLDKMNFLRNSSKLFRCVNLTKCSKFNEKSLHNFQKNFIRQNKKNSKQSTKKNKKIYVL